MERVSKIENGGDLPEPLYQLKIGDYAAILFTEEGLYQLRETIDLAIHEYITMGSED